MGTAHLTLLAFAAFAVRLSSSLKCLKCSTDELTFDCLVYPWKNYVQCPSPNDRCVLAQGIRGNMGAMECFWWICIVFGCWLMRGLVYLIGFGLTPWLRRFVRWAVFLMAITDKWLNVDVTGGGLLSLSSVEILCDAALPVKLAWAFKVLLYHQFPSKPGHLQFLFV